jgi:peptidyl-prolyl cis-trans isomerase C
MLEYNSSTQNERGNAVVLVLLALVVVAIGAGAYLNKDKFMDKTADTAVPAQTAQAEDAAASQPASGLEAATDASANENAPQPVEIKEGNPVVAKIGKKEITRGDVVNYIQKLPQNMQQLPPQQLFPLATVQVVNAELIQKKSKAAKLDNDPEVKKQLEAAKEQIVRSMFIQKEVEKAMTDERLQGAYAEYKKNFPEIKEVRARHILVKEEADAKEAIKKLNGGADFAELAKEMSIDGTKDTGGELNYFSEKDVVPDFAAAAFAQEVGKISAKPVKTEFGYHVIEVQDKRNRPAAEYDVAKPFLASQLQNAVLEEILQKWRADSDVEIFDINGDAFAPASGE